MNSSSHFVDALVCEPNFQLYPHMHLFFCCLCFQRKHERKSWKNSLEKNKKIKKTNKTHEHFTMLSSVSFCGFKFRFWICACVYLKMHVCNKGFCSSRVGVGWESWKRARGPETEVLESHKEWTQAHSSTEEHEDRVKATLQGNSYKKNVPEPRLA